MINILFCGNDKVFDGVLLTSLSILERTKTSEPFTFYIFTMDVSHLDPRYLAMTDEQASQLEKVVKQYNKENRVIKIDVRNLYDQEFAASPNEQCYCSPYTLLRLFAGKVEGIPEKLLYLDADLMFNDDITKLWNIDISKVEYAAARDHYGKIILFFNRKFINAGVILFNMTECKKNNFFDKCCQLIKTKKLTFADESAIIRSTTKQMVISQRFNDQKFLYPKTVIRHFSKRLFYLPYPHTENIKQWMVEKVHKKFHYKNWDDVYAKYDEIKKNM